MRLANIASFSLCCCLAVVATAGLAAPTFQQLMDPKMFPDAQRGMAVESATMHDGLIRIRTTGAEIAIATATGEIRFSQRLGHPRPLATMKMGEPLQGWKQPGRDIRLRFQNTG